MTVNLLDNGEQWDRFIEDSPYSTLFHRWKFLKIVEKHSGYRLLQYGVYRGSELTCVFPAFYRSIAGVRMVFSPPPRSVVPNLGPVMSADYAGLKQNKRETHLNGAIDELNAEIAKLAPRYTFISTVPGLDDARPFQWSGYDVRVRYTYVLDLRPPLDQIWGGFSQGCRKNIKACGKHPITIERTTDVGTFNGIMLDRLGSKGLSSPTHGTAYLRELLEAFPDNLKMYFVCSGGEIG